MLSKRPLIINNSNSNSSNTKVNEDCPDLPPEFIDNIFRAIRFRDLYSVRYIACQNPNVLKSKTDSEMDPLQVAIRSGLYGIAEDFVLKYPSYVDLNYQNNKGNTCLHFAYYAKNSFITCSLLKNGANKAIKNNDDITPVEAGKGWEPTCNN